MNNETENKCHLIFHIGQYDMLVNVATTYYYVIL